MNVHANRPLTPPLRRMGRQQSVRWGRAAARKDQGQSGKVRGHNGLARARGVPDWMVNQRPSRFLTDSPAGLPTSVAARSVHGR